MLREQLLLIIISNFSRSGNLEKLNIYTEFIINLIEEEGKDFSANIHTSYNWIAVNLTTWIHTHNDSLLSRNLNELRYFYKQGAVSDEMIVVSITMSVIYLNPTDNKKLLKITCICGSKMACKKKKRLNVIILFSYNITLSDFLRKV